MEGPKKLAFFLTIAALVIEVILAIPILGGSIIIGLSYWPLIILFIMYVVNLVIRISAHIAIPTPIVGILATVVAVIPIVGWVLHIVMVIVLIADLLVVKFK